MLEEHIKLHIEVLFKFPGNAIRQKISIQSWILTDFQINFAKQHAFI